MLFVEYKNCSKVLFDLFVGWLVWGFLSHSRIFHSCEDVTIAGEGLQILPLLGTYGH